MYLINLLTFVLCRDVHTLVDHACFLRHRTTENTFDEVTNSVTIHTNNRIIVDGLDCMSKALDINSSSQSMGVDI